MSDYNNVVLTGRIATDILNSVAKNGSNYVTFSIACNRTYTKDGNKIEEASFFNCVSFGELSKIINQYGYKGQKILLSGRLQQKTWQDKDGNKRSSVDIFVNEIQFLSRKQQDAQKSTSYENTTEKQKNIDFDKANTFSDPDIPF